MALRIALASITVLVLVAELASGQAPPRPGDPRYAPAPPRASQPAGQAQAPPYQAAPPRAPTIERRVQPRPTAPFTLTPQQQDQVDWVLTQWETQGKKVKTFECKVTQFKYLQGFGRTAADGRAAPTYKDEGKIWYAAPDKGRFEIHGERAEKWICDGEAVYQYNPKQKTVAKYVLPPQLRGETISQGPLPFLFGSTAGDLRRRYWIRLTQPPEGVEGQVWLQAFPKYQQDRAEFKSAEMILTMGEMRPIALLTVLPNDDKVSYRFHDMKVNARNVLDFLSGDPFHASVPKGWKMVTEHPPRAASQPERPGSAPRR